MPNEKYLNYAGLQYYHEKLNLDLASMLMTDDDLDIVLFDELGIIPPLPETWTESSNGTLNLALGDAFSYWPESAGTKTISITNGTTAGISKFFLKLTDAGNFFVEWGSNIQWKDGSEPVWQAFHEDIIMFKSNDGGNTWTAQVVQTNAITPYWKLTVQMPARHYWNDAEVTRYRILLPFKFTNSAVIDWGDGIVETPETARPDRNYEYCYHTYQADGIYHIKVQYDDFENLYIGNWVSTDYGVESEAYDVMPSYLVSVISIDSPLPKLKGSYLDTSSSWHSEDNNFREIFCDYNLTSVPEKLFCNNPNITNLADAFEHTNIQDITLYINSPNVTLDYDNWVNLNFIDPSGQNPTRIIYVPCGSNTYTNFMKIASSDNLTIRGIPNDNTFVYTVTTDSDKKSAIPFTLYNVPNTTLCVDWGDGTTSSLTSSNYSEYNTMSSVHTYASVGTYTIKVNCNNWNNIYLLQADLSPFGSFEVTNNYIKTEESYVLTRDNGPIVPIYYWRSTINAINTALPALKGTQTYIADPQDYEDYIAETCNNQIILQECAFETIPSNLFENNLLSTSFSYCFYDCCNLVSIPTKLFKQCTAVTNFNNCFKGCTYLDDFTLEIGSSSVSNASDFVTEKTGTTRTINVPSGSTTQTAFNSVASSLGLTIVGV